MTVVKLFQVVVRQSGDESGVEARKVVPAAGVEPATFRSGGERSNPLSYAGLNKIAGFKEELSNEPLFCTPFCTPRQYRLLGFTSGRIAQIISLIKTFFRARTERELMDYRLVRLVFLLDVFTHQNWKLPLPNARSQKEYEQLKLTIAYPSG